MRIQNFALCFLILFTVNCKAKTDKIVWKYGVATINGHAKYIDVKKLDQSRMTIAKSHIKKLKSDNKDRPLVFRNFPA